MTRLAETAANDNINVAAAISSLLSGALRRRAFRTFQEREAAALELANEAVRLTLEAELQAIAEGIDEAVELNECWYRQHEPGTVVYHSLCGPLRILRWTHRKTGVRNGPTIVPLDLVAGLIERATPALARAVAQGYAKAPIRSVRFDLVSAHRAPPSRATLERMAKAIGTHATKALIELEGAVAQNEQVPPTAVAMTLGLDRTTVPMEELEVLADDSTRTVVKYRMAYVGTVALTNREGDLLRSRKYAVPAHEGPEQLLARMMRDLRQARSERPSLFIGVVQDGAPELWRLMREALQTECEVGSWYEAVDMFHLMERVAKALEIVEPDASKRAAQIAKWKVDLKSNDGAISRIASFFELSVGWLRSHQKRKRQSLLASGWIPTRGGLMFPDASFKPPPPPRVRWTAEQARQIEDILFCYLASPDPFRYARMLRLGMHVGSGVTEGACKSLIAARAKRSGQRWRAEGISAVLTLRSLLESERFDPFWQRLANTFAPLAA